MRRLWIRFMSLLLVAGTAAFLAVPGVNAPRVSAFWIWHSSYISADSCQDARRDLTYQGIPYSRTRCVFDNLPPRPWELQINY